MSPEKYLEFYKKYVNGKIDLFGVYLIPVDISDEYEVTYHVSNPNNVSYSKESIKGWITENRVMFNNALGLDEHVMSYFDCKPLYISDEVVYEITDYFRTVKTVRVGAWEIRVRHKYFTAGIRQEDSLVVTNYVEPIQAYVTTANVGRKETDLSTAISHYQSWQAHSKYDETERCYPKFDEIIDRHPALVDNDWMVQYVITDFTTTD